MFRWVRVLPILACVVGACGGPPTEPGLVTFTDGRWTGDGPCLSVAGPQCNFTIGCGHGQFPVPMLRADGSFDVDGTYRLEVGPIGVDPAPPAHFSGVLTGTTLTLTVVPRGSGPLGPYTLRPADSGACLVPCLTPFVVSPAAQHPRELVPAFAGIRARFTVSEALIWRLPARLR